MPTLSTPWKKDGRSTKTFATLSAIRCRPTSQRFPCWCSQPCFRTEALPLTATQILVINILMDGPPAVALGVEKKHGSVMDRPPRPVDEGLPNGRDISLIFYLGAVMVVGSLMVFWLAGGSLAGAEPCTLRTTETSTTAFDMEACLAGEQAAIDDWQSYADGHFQHAQTMTFAVFIVYQLFNVMNCRSNEESVFELGLFSNPAINYALLISSGLLLFLCPTCRGIDSGAGHRNRFPLADQSVDSERLDGGCPDCIERVYH